MSWYAAHVVMVVHYKHGRQTKYPAWENIVLVRAANVEDAFAKAERYGRAEEGDDGGDFHWGRRPATWKFAGVRKVTECAFETGSPCDLGEVTYTECVFASRSAIEKYVSGEQATLTVDDRFASEPHVNAVASRGATKTKRPRTRKLAASG
jgi:hypothetical protein